MDTVFPDIPLYRSWGAPLRPESDIRDVEVVQGQVPRELSGSLYRCANSIPGCRIRIDSSGLAGTTRMTWSTPRVWRRNWRVMGMRGRISVRSTRYGGSAVPTTCS
jgi:hypothetical protein